MTGWTKYLILMVLSAPLLGWAGWHAYGGSRDQLLAAAPPADAGEPDAKAHKDTVAAAAEARLLTRGVVLFEPAPPQLVEAAAKEAARATADRTGELLDLQSFLAGRGEFVGPHKDRWAAHYRAQRGAREKSAALVRRKDSLPAVLAPSEAQREVRNFLLELKEFREADWADLAAATNWELEVRARLVVAEYAWAEGKYTAALRRPTAGAGGEWDELKAALPEVRGGADAAVRLEGDALRDTTFKVHPDAAREVEEARKRRNEWENREKLFSLPLNAPWGVAPDRLAGLLDDVTRLYDRLKPNDTGRVFIRQKLQDFCAAYIPPKLRLDPDVVFGFRDGKARLEPRGQVSVTYADDKKAYLSPDPDGVNEHNFLTKLPNVTEVGIPGSGLRPGNLKATAASTAAYRYFEARKAIADGSWTPAAVDRLVSACEEFHKDAKKDFNPDNARAIMNAIPELTTRPDGAGPAQIVTRLDALAAAMRRQPTELFAPPAR